MECLLKHLAFDNMKKNPAVNPFASAVKPRGLRDHFVREGKVVKKKKKLIKKKKTKKRETHIVRGGTFSSGARYLGKICGRNEKGYQVFILKSTVSFEQFPRD